MIKPTHRTIIVDDEPGAISNLEALLHNHPEIRVIETIHDATIAVDSILDQKPDLLFLDIQMPGKTGFEIAKELLEAGDPPTIIFATGFDQFAIEAIRHAAFDFLVKPVNPEELKKAIERFLEKS
jgi:DNA-binding LytR/AlgR family response regulator